jgi:hypothetical protein
MICSRPNFADVLGAAPAVSRAIRLTSTQLCREKADAKIAPLHLLIAKALGCFGRVFEVKCSQYIVSETIPAKSALGRR